MYVKDDSFFINLNNFDIWSPVAQYIAVQNLGIQHFKDPIFCFLLKTPLLPFFKEPNTDKFDNIPPHYCVSAMWEF